MVYGYVCIEENKSLRVLSVLFCQKYVGYKFTLKVYACASCEHNSSIIRVIRLTRVRHYNITLFQRTLLKDYEFLNQLSSLFHFFYRAVAHTLKNSKSRFGLGLLYPAHRFFFRSCT